MIKGSYIVTLEEFLKSTEYNTTQEIRPALRAMILPCGIALILIGILIWNIVAAGLAGSLIFFGFYFISFSKPVGKWKTTREYRKRPDQNIEVSFTANDEGMSWSTQDSDSSHAWKLIVQVQQFPDGVLLYAYQERGIWIPDHAFDSTDDVETFKLLLQEQVKDYQ